MNVAYDRPWLRIVSAFIVAAISVQVSASWESAADIRLLFVLTNVAAWTIADAIFRGGTAPASRLMPTRTLGREVMWGLLFATVPLLIVASTAVGMGASFRWEADLALPLLLMIVPQAVLEELFFRGVMFDALREQWGDVTAIVLMSVFFALAHMFNPAASPLALINVGLAGVLLAVMVVRTASLWPSIVFHVTWNSVLAGVLVTPVSGIDYMPDQALDLAPVIERYPSLGPLLFGSGFGLEEGLLVTILLVAAIVIAARTLTFSPYVTAAVLRMKYLRSTS
jgi:membrane protease YdiL (CAAX protease family)